MRLIDAGYIKSIMLNDRLMQGNCEWELWKQEVNRKVNAMPGVDLVRCKECKHCDYVDMKTHLWCDCQEHYVLADDFCSYGEREGE